VSRLLARSGRRFFARHPWQFVLAVAGVMFSVIGAFYYLRVVKLMYFDEAAEEAPLAAGSDLRIVLSCNGLLVLALGIFPQVLIGAVALAL